MTNRLQKFKKEITSFNFLEINFVIQSTLKIKIKLKIMITNKQRSFVIYGLAALLLVIPFIGMQFTKEINWSGFDFLIAGILLFGTAFCVDMVLKMEKKNARRMFYIVLILLALFLIWAELAVGIFGSPFAGS